MHPLPPVPAGTIACGCPTVGRVVAAEAAAAACTSATSAPVMATNTSKASATLMTGGNTPRREPHTKAQVGPRKLRSYASCARAERPSGNALGRLARTSKRRLSTTHTYQMQNCHCNTPKHWNTCHKTPRRRNAETQDRISREALQPANQGRYHISAPGPRCYAG